MKKIKKILLINPPQVAGGIFLDGYQGTRPVLPPLGLAYIASYLEKHGHQVDIFDGMVETASPKEIARRSLNYDLIGITSITFQVLLAYGVLKEVRRNNPQIPIVIGGPHVSALPLEPLNRGLADFSVIGEGEETMLKIIRTLEENGDFTAIPGVAFRREDRIYPATGSGIIKDLNLLPFPARHLLPMKKYRPSAIRGRRFPAASMITSRGCPMRCTFCFNQLPYRKMVRFTSVEKIVDEMIHLISTYGIREIHFWDDNFLLDKARINEFCEILESRKLSIPFDCEGIINSFDPNILERLKKVGCYSVSYGIESGNQRILDKIKKQVTIDKIKNVVKMTKAIGLDVRGYFLFGFPTETRDEILETIAFAKSLQLSDATFSLLIPLPGTEIYQEVHDKPQFMKEYWNKLVLSEISFPRLPLVYHPADVDETELLTLHRLALKSFYLQPRQILNKLLRAFSSYGVFKESIKGLKTVLCKSGVGSWSTRIR